jgi:hypothetical protein
MSGTKFDPIGTSHLSVITTPDGNYTFELHDGKDRTGGILKITMPNGMVIESQTTSVSASQPIYTQHDLTELLAEILQLRTGQPEQPPPPAPALRPSR